MCCLLYNVLSYGAMAQLLWRAGWALSWAVPTVVREAVLAVAVRPIKNLYGSVEEDVKLLRRRVPHPPPPPPPTLSGAHACMPALVGHCRRTCMCACLGGASSVFAGPCLLPGRHKLACLYCCQIPHVKLHTIIYDHQLFLLLVDSINCKVQVPFRSSCKCAKLL